MKGDSTVLYIQPIEDRVSDEIPDSVSIEYTYEVLGDTKRFIIYQEVPQWDTTQHFI